MQHKLPISFAVFILALLAANAHATTILIHAGDNFQTKLATATCGDTVIVDANSLGGVFTTSADNGFTATQVCAANNPITVQSSRISELPAGTRIVAADAPKLFALKAAAGTPALTVSGSGWIWRGMEVTTTDRSVYRSILVQATGADLTFERTYVHSLEDGTTFTDASVRIGYLVNGQRITIQDSRVAYFAAYVLNSKTVDNNFAILNESGTDITYTNNFVGAWYNNIFFGGVQFGGYTSATVSAGATMTTATLSTVSNLHVNDLIAFQQSATYWGAVKVSAINGSVVTYAAYSTNSPLTAPPTNGAAARWNGSVPSNITMRRNEFWKDPVTTTTILNESPDPNNQHFPKGYWEVKSVDTMLVEGNT